MQFVGAYHKYHRVNRPQGFDAKHAAIERFRSLSDFRNDLGAASGLAPSE